MVERALDVFTHDLDVVEIIGGQFTSNLDGNHDSDLEFLIC